MRVDPTECDGAVGGWKFDPSDGRHQGWESKFAEFMRVNEQRLLAVVRRLAHGFTVAELDPEHVTQVTWARVALRWPQIEAMEDDPMRYVYRVARNMVMKAYASRAALAYKVAIRPGWTSSGQQAGPVADLAAEAADAAAMAEWEDDLLDRLSPSPARLALRDLRGHQKAAMYLRAVEGWKHCEIAEVLGVSEADVRTYTSRAKANLRRQLVDTAARATAFGFVVVVGIGVVFGVTGAALSVLASLMSLLNVDPLTLVVGLAVVIAQVRLLLRRHSDQLKHHVRLMKRRDQN